MKYRYLLAAGLLLSMGCAADDKGQWDAFWKDLRGDNMKMQTENWGKESMSERASKTNN
jgi:hypothetical protein